MWSDNHTIGKTVARIPFAVIWFLAVLAGCSSLRTAPRPPWIDDESNGVAGSGLRDHSTYNLPELPLEVAPSSDMPLGVDEPAVPDSSETETGPRIFPQGVTVPATLELSVDSPSRKQIQSDAVFRLTVQNIGDTTAEEVVVESEFDNSLVFPGRREKKVRQSLGSLVAQETKEIALTLISDEIGEHCCRFTVFSKGKEEAWKSVCVEFLPRQLDVEIVGPSTRTVGSRAEFTFKLINKSSSDLKDVQATVLYDAALTPREATAGVAKQPGSLSWELGTIVAGSGVLLQVEFECRAAAKHSTLKLRVNGGEIPEEQSEIWLTVAPIEGALDLQVSDKTDPVSLGDVAEFVILVRNRGLQVASGIGLYAKVSDNLRVVSTEVVKAEQQLNIDSRVVGQTLQFDSIPSLAPDEVLQFTVVAKTLRSGDGTLKASLTHAATSVRIDATEIATINP